MTLNREVTYIERARLKNKEREELFEETTKKVPNTEDSEYNKRSKIKSPQYHSQGC